MEPGVNGSESRGRDGPDDVDTKRAAGGRSPAPGTTGTATGGRGKERAALSRPSTALFSPADRSFVSAASPRLSIYSRATTGRDSAGRAAGFRSERVTGKLIFPVYTRASGPTGYPFASLRFGVGVSLGRARRDGDVSNDIRLWLPIFGVAPLRRRRGVASECPAPVACLCPLMAGSRLRLFNGKHLRPARIDCTLIFKSDI